MNNEKEQVEKYVDQFWGQINDTDMTKHRHSIGTPCDWTRDTSQYKGVIASINQMTAEELPKDYDEIISNEYLMKDRGMFLDIKDHIFNVWCFVVDRRTELANQVNA